MALLYLVRHGQAQAGFDQASDPSLTSQGRQQAEDVARDFTAKVPLRLATSPLARARETAEPLSRLWHVPVAVEPRVAEIPSPTDDLSERGQWLAAVMGQRWSQLSVQLQRWRDDLVRCLLEQEEDVAFFSHFIAINAAAGAAIGDDRVVHCRPDNCSVTVIDNDRDRLTLVQAAGEATTHVN